MNKKWWIIGAIVAAAVAIWWFFIKKKDDTEDKPPDGSTGINIDVSGVVETIDKAARDAANKITGIFEDAIGGASSMVAQLVKNGTGFIGGSVSGIFGAADNTLKTAAGGAFNVITEVAGEGWGVIAGGAKYLESGVQTAVGATNQLGGTVLQQSTEFLKPIGTVFESTARVGLSGASAVSGTLVKAGQDTVSFVTNTAQGVLSGIGNFFGMK